jgi:hypothetical protein
VVGRIAKRYSIPRTVPVLALLLVMVLLFSLLMFFLSDRGTRRKVFFFPQYRSSQVAGEVRSLPVRNSLEDNITLLVKEQLLGPVVVTNDRLFPPSTVLRTLLVRNDTLYINLSVDAILGRRSTESSFEESVAVLERTIRFNYPEIDRVIVAIEGEIPDFTGSKKDE